jgi:hypothetical protein
MLSGGIPEWASPAGIAIPSAVFGLVADNVKRISYEETGRSRRLELRNNTFFIEVPSDPRGILRIEFRSGKRARIAIGRASGT